MRPERNDSLTVKSYRFTNLPLIIRIYKWRYWQQVYFLILVYIIGYIINKLYKRYLNYKANKEKVLKLQKQQKKTCQNIRRRRSYKV